MHADPMSTGQDILQQKEKQKKGGRRKIGSIALVILLLSLLCACEPSAARLDRLRERYPVIPQTSSWMESVHHPFSEVVDACGAYVCVEVLEEPSTRIRSANAVYFLDVPVKIEQVVLDHRRALDGDPVPADLEIWEGKTVTLSINEDLAFRLPNMEQGDRFLLSITASNRDAGPARAWDYWIGHGIYYLVEDELVLSAFPEEAGEVYSGMRLRKFIKEVRKLDSD